MVEFFILFLVFLVPGLIAALLFKRISCRKLSPGYFLSIALIFDLFILIKMLIGLFYIKGIHTLSELIAEFQCLHFTFLYALLCIAIGIVLGVITGIIFKCRFHHHHSSHTS